MQDCLIVQIDPAARSASVYPIILEGSFRLAHGATRQLASGKIDLRLGGPRNDAKAAPEKQAS